MAWLSAGGNSAGGFERGPGPGVTTRAAGGAPNCVAVRTPESVGGSAYAVDPVCRPVSSMAAGSGEQLHPGRIHSHSAGAGSDCVDLPAHQRPPDSRIAPCRPTGRSTGDCFTSRSVVAVGIAKGRLRASLIFLVVRR